MAKITLNNPDFESNHETETDDLTLAEEVKSLLDERRSSLNTNDFVPWKEAKK